MPEFFVIFARKINKISEFYMIFARILHNNCPKNIFPELLGGTCPLPLFLRLCAISLIFFDKNDSRITILRRSQKMHLTITQ